MRADRWNKQKFRSKSGCDTGPTSKPLLLCRLQGLPRCRLRVRDCRFYTQPTFWGVIFTNAFTVRCDFPVLPTQDITRSPILQPGATAAKSFPRQRIERLRRGEPAHSKGCRPAVMTEFRNGTGKKTFPIVHRLRYDPARFLQFSQIGRIP
jgi:hypothetical protein